jgi:hypothetical protein
VSDVSGIEPRTDATAALSVLDALTTRLDLIHSPLSLQRTSNSYCPRLFLPYRTGLLTFTPIVSCFKPDYWLLHRQRQVANFLAPVWGIYVYYSRLWKDWFIDPPAM